MSAAWSILILVIITALLIRSSKKEQIRKSVAYESDDSGGSNDSDCLSERELLQDSQVPDGKYLVRYVDEKAYHNSSILIVFQITQGSYAGKRIVSKFEGSKARRVVRDWTGDYIGHLASEGVGIADKLDTIRMENLSQEFKEVEFIIRSESGYLVAAYAFDENEIRRFGNRVKKNPDFKGEKETIAQSEIILSNHRAANLSFRLKGIPENVELSVRGPESNYSVNLFQMTCTCSDFQKKSRVDFAVDDVRRPCKHLIKMLLKKQLLNQSDEMIQCLLEYLPSEKHLVANNMTSGAAVIFCYGSSSWVDVFSRKRRKGDGDGKYTGNYDRFGFNVEENRWSYGEGPPGALEIRGMIKALNYQP